MPQNYVHVITALRILYREIELWFEATIPFLLWNTYHFLVKINGLTGRKKQAASYKLQEEKVKSLFKSKHVANLIRLFKACS